ncbi:MAG TPA: hypothetical protein VN224_09345 [Xanthomonadales bacterium]|nr:hypothetical protein [Xanthomonadales bacterium]
MQDFLNTSIVETAGDSSNFSLDTLQDPDWYVVGGSGYVFIVK